MTVLQGRHHHGGGVGRLALGVPSSGVLLWSQGGIHGYARLLPLQGCCGDGGGVLLSLVECVVGLGLNQAKAFTDTPVGGIGDGVLECRSPS
jgi:hypothetical protein